MISATAGRWGRLALAIGLAALLAATCADAYVRADTSRLHGKDFACFYNAATRVRLGEPLYVSFTDPRPYNYLPGLAIVLVPLSWAPREAAWHLWLAASIGCVIGSAWAFGRLCGLDRRGWAVLALLTVLALRYRPVEISLGLGQANLLLLAIVTGMTAAYHHGRHTSLGGLIVAGAMAKTWMLGWIGFLCLKGRWRAGLITAIACAAAVEIAFAIVGWDQLSSFLFTTRAFLGDIGSWWVVSQSLPAAARAHLRGTPLVRPLMHSQVLEGLTVFVGTVALLAGLSVLRRRREGATVRRSALEVGLFCVTLILLLPYCDPGYFTPCLPLFWALILAPDARASRGGRAVALVLYVLMLVPYPIGGRDLAGWQDGVRSLATTGFFTVMLGTWLLTLHELRRA